MRMIGYLMVAGFLLLLVAGPGRWAWESLDREELAAFISGRLEGAQSSTGYLQQGEEWLEFRLDGNGSSVHVVTNATLSRAQAAGDGVHWWYAFRYQLLDSSGTLVREGEYHHRTHVSWYREPRHGHLVTRTFLLEPARVPTDGRRMVMPLQPGERPARLRLRVSYADAGLRDVLFRVYEREALPEYKLDYRWQRLSEPRKQMLSRGSVYGSEHLRTGERRNLLRARWRPLGPAGIKGYDFQQRKLYAQEDAPGESDDAGVIPFGLYVDSTTSGIIPLPAGGGRIRLQWEPVAVPADGSSADGPLQVRWYGRNLAERSTTRVPAADPQGRFEAEFDEGLLELVSGRPLVFRVWVDRDGVQQEITPEPVRLRAYQPGESLPLVYRVDHVANQLTPVRIDVRAVLTRDGTPAQQPVRFEILDTAGRRLAAGDLHRDAAPSAYDRLPALEPGARLSEPGRNYFNLPAEAAEVRIHAAGDVLVSAYTRPADLVREVRYPEDLVRAELDAQDDGQGQPGWFVLQPANQQALLTGLRSHVLLLQNRPPEDDPRVLAGRYGWEDYHPEGEWSGRHLLLPRAGGLPVRDQSRGALYAELPGGREITGVLRDFAGHRELRPTLIFRREDDQPAAVNVLLDGSPWYTTRIFGNSGQLALPPAPAGRHRIRIEGPDAARWFMNYLDAGDARHVRRLAIGVPAGGLEFIYHKQGIDAEVLTGQLYRAHGERVRLHVEVDHARTAQLQPLADWTFVRRIYDLGSTGAPRVMVLNAGTGTVDGGQRFFIPLGTDLPPGHYRIRIRPEREAGAYLALYRLQPGQELVRVFLRETGYED